MNLSNVMNELGDALSAIAGLRVYPYPAHAVTPPAAIVSWPDPILFDETYGRGMDTFEDMPVVVVAGRAQDRASALNLAAYADGSGPTSVKAAIESATYTALDTVRVKSVIFDIHTIGGTDYLAAVFALDIAGSGS